MASEPTPLPTSQVACVLLVHIADGLNGGVLVPFISFFVASLGVSKEGQGFYTGLLFAAYNIAQFFSSSVWGAFSDRFGRKICLTLGLLGAGLSVAWFGVSKSYESAFLARFCGGLLNGNLGVSKSVLAEVTDKSNRSQAFALLPLAYGTSCVLAPIIGGLLCEPAKQYPGTFSPTGFFGTYPYALPCFVCATYAILAACTVQVVFKESRKAPTRPSMARLIGNSSAESTLTNPTQTRSFVKDETVWELLLQEDVWFATSSYGLIAFVYMILDGFLPLFCQRPLGDYGLAYDSRDIGVMMSAASIVVVPLSVYLPPKLDRKFGEIWLHRWPQLPNAACAFIIPFTYFLPGTALAWSVLVIVLTIMGICKNFAFLSIMLLINNSVPMSKLGRVNGIGQSWAALARSTGPAFGGLIWGMAVVVGGAAILLPFIMAAFMIWYAYDYAGNLPASLEMQKPESTESTAN